MDNETQKRVRQRLADLRRAGMVQRALTTTKLTSTQPYMLSEADRRVIDGIVDTKSFKLLETNVPSPKDVIGKGTSIETIRRELEQRKKQANEMLRELGIEYHRTETSLDEAKDRIDMKIYQRAVKCIEARSSHLVKDKFHNDKPDNILSLDVLVLRSRINALKNLLKTDSTSPVLFTLTSPTLLRIPVISHLESQIISLFATRESLIHEQSRTEHALRSHLHELASLRQIQRSITQQTHHFHEILKHHHHRDGSQLSLWLQTQLAARLESAHAEHKTLVKSLKLVVRSYLVPHMAENLRRHPSLFDTGRSTGGVGIGVLALVKTRKLRDPRYEATVLIELVAELLERNFDGDNAAMPVTRENEPAARILVYSGVALFTSGRVPTIRLRDFSAH